MFSQIMLGVCVLSMSVLCIACYSAEQLSRDQIVPGNDYDILEVETTSGDHYVMRELSGTRGIVQDSTIIGAVEEGEQAKIPLSQVRSVQISSLDWPKTTLFIVLGLPVGFFVLTGLLVAANGGV